MSADAVITDQLSSFKDVVELHEQHTHQLATIRQLTSDLMEAHRKIDDGSTDKEEITQVASQDISISRYRHRHHHPMYDAMQWG